MFTSLPKWEGGWEIGARVNPEASMYTFLDEEATNGMTKAVETTQAGHDPARNKQCFQPSYLHRP